MSLWRRGSLTVRRSGLGCSRWRGEEGLGLCIVLDFNCSKELKTSIVMHGRLIRDLVGWSHFRRSIDERGWWNLGWAINGGFERSLE